jgi:hypothetical protein
MRSALTFAAGFAAGWMTRSTVDSSHAAVVDLLAAVLAAIERAKRTTAAERERLEDLVAEARSQAEQRRARRAAHDGAGGHAERSA